MSSTLSSALAILASTGPPASGGSEETKSRAAESGCSRSWLAAATKRDLEALARSAAASASSRSSVRSITRRSSVSLARSSSSAAS